LNYFQLFNLEQKFSIELDKLNERYQTLQRTVHPDKFAQATKQDQLMAVKKSTLVNDAYQTLKNPLKRAEYMLVLRKVDLPSEQSSFSDNSFLMRQMELREMLAEVKYADNLSSAVFEVSQVLELEFEQLFKQMQIALLENTDKANKLASELLRKLKFYQKLHVERDSLEDLLFD
jgi:molecular chaperone HscB